MELSKNCGNHVFSLINPGLILIVVITTAQLNSTKSEPRFCADSNPTLGMSKIWDGESPRQ